MKFVIAKWHKLDETFFSRYAFVLKQVLSWLKLFPQQSIVLVRVFAKNILNQICFKITELGVFC